MKIAFTDKGNHSIATGYLLREGELQITPSCSHDVFDISPLYDLIYFDGTRYRWLPRDEYHDAEVGAAQSFEFGCIFELGRLLLAAER